VTVVVASVQTGPREAAAAPIGDNAPVERQERELATVVGELARAAGRTLDPATILERTMAVLDPILGASSASVWLDDERVPRRVASRPAPGAEPGDDIDAGGVVIALEGVDRTLGRLVVTPADGRDLTAAERGLLEIAASQVAGALERTRLFSEVMELERLKSDFVARVSHELRTPITIINGFLETLLAHGDDLAADQREHMLHRSHMASSRLARLIEELLILSRIDAGVLTPAAAVVDIASLLDEVRRSAQEPDQVLIAAPEDGRCTTDADLLGRALGLLVDNAIKYGGIAEVRAVHVDGSWAFEVRDRGAGFPSDVRSNAFEMFTRSSDTTSVPGLGVGLPIARTLVEVLDGSIRIDTPADGIGAVVRVQIPG
jgi:signal transduction histidine kinase